MFMDEGTVSQPASREDWSRWFWNQGAYGIVPVSPATKKPLTDSWKRWQTKRMTEADLNLALSSEQEWAPAVVPGESTLLCIDCDCVHAVQTIEAVGVLKATLCEYRPEASDRLHVWMRSTGPVKAANVRCHICGKEKAFDIRSGHLYTIAPGTNRLKRPESPLVLRECEPEQPDALKRLFSCATKLASVVMGWGWSHGKGGCNQYTLGLSCVMFFAGVEETEAKLLVGLALRFLGDPEERASTVEGTYRKGDAGLQISRHGITDEQRDAIRGVLRIFGFGTMAKESAARAEDPAEERPPGGAAPGARVSYPKTDTGNAKMFADGYHGRLRYDHEREAWFVWVSHWWSEDKVGEATELAKAAVRQRAADAQAIIRKTERDLELGWCKTSESRPRIEAMLALARSDPRIATGGAEWDPDPFLMAVENGVLDLRTGGLQPGKPGDMMTLHAPIEYDDLADAPRWEQFIDEIFCGDKELIEFIHKALGHSLTGSVREQFWFLCWGSGANGKSTMFKAVRHVVGSYAFNVPFQTFEQQSRTNIPSDVASLVGRRFVTALESSESSRLNEARIKLLTGADPVTARHLYGRWFEFVPVGKLWLATNHRPRVYDDSFAFWRRVCLIPFNARFEGDRADKDIEEKLSAEAPGILRWLVEGCLKWQKDGMQPPPVVLSATEEYRQESDALAEFFEEKCSFEDGSEVGASEIVGAYADWCNARGMGQKERLGSKTFLGLLAKRYPKKKTKRGRFYMGLRLKAQQQIPRDNSTPEGPRLNPEEKQVVGEQIEAIKSIIREERAGLGAPESALRDRANQYGIGTEKFAWLLQHLSERGTIYSDEGPDGATHWKLTDGR